MFEIAGFLTLLLIGAVVFCLLACVGLVLKLLFKVVLLPFALVGFVLKAVFAILAVVVGLIVAPVLVVALGSVIVFLAIPFLLLFGVLGAGFALAT